MSMITCPHCGNRVSDSDGTCFVCGAILPELHLVSVPDPDRPSVDSDGVQGPQISAEASKEKKANPFLFFSLLIAILSFLCALILSMSHDMQKEEADKLHQAVYEIFTTQK